MTDLISDKDLFFFNSQGLIPGPLENEKEFLQRVDYCLRLKENFHNLLEEQQVPFKNESPISGEMMEKVSLISKKVYDISPNWIPIFFSNYQLTFWQGGCAWIYQQTEESPTAAFLQLRKVFKTRLKYWIYYRDELVIHEFSHVGRMMFEEPKFEEILAYRSSSSKFRRWFGAIVQSSRESVLFLFSLCLVIIADLFFYGTALQIWSKLFPLLLFGMALTRLWIRQWQFSKCLNNLIVVLLDEKKANAVAYRLTDVEIIQFSQQTPNELLKFINEQKNQSLRWRLIQEVYF